MNKTTIRLSAATEIVQISAFLAEHWRSDHVFVRRPEICWWQHFEEATGRLNFVIAEEDGEIVGLLGFVPFRRFDPTLATDTVALAIWKVTESAAVGTGVQLLLKFMAIRRPTTTLAIGLSDMVVPIYRALGFTTGIMNHFAIFRPAERFAGSTEGHESTKRQLGSGIEVLGRSFDLADSLQSRVEVLLRANALEKSISYYRNRFVKHPWHRYQPLIVGKDGHTL